MKITYYLATSSSWCFWAEPMWAELKLRYAGRAEFEWKIARMQPGDFAASRTQYDWMLQRSGTIMRSPIKLSSASLEPLQPGCYPASCAVAEAARDFGFTGDEIRLALARAAYIEGRQTYRMDVAVEVGAHAGNLPADKLRARAESPEVEARLIASTNEFFAHQINQRPAFVITDAIGDKAVLSGLLRLEPLAATIDAMLGDTAAYASYRAHFGEPPSG